MALRWPASSANSAALILGIRMAVLVAGFLTAAVIGACAFLVVEGHPIPAVAVLGWAMLAFLTGRAARR